MPLQFAASLPPNAPIAGRASLLALSLAIAGLSGCSTLGGLASAPNSSLPTALAARLPDTELLSSVPTEKVNSASRQLAVEGLKAMDAKDYRRASDIFNLAVKTDMTNSYLHFLNAVAYQFRGVTGESALFPLAEQGYQMAVRFDESNWLARYYSGLLAMHQRDWAGAQSRLAEAALYAGDQPDLLYDLAVASYYNRDPKTAAAALAGLRTQQEGAADDPRILRASAIVAAALNQTEEADGFLDRLRAASLAPGEVKHVAERLRTWASAYQGGLMKTQFPGGGSFPQAGAGFPSGGGNFQQPGGGFPQQPGFPQAAYPGQQPGFGAQPSAYGMGGAFQGNVEFIEKKMAVVDVVILSTEEDNSHSMGVNLLDGLKIQFGNQATLTPGFSGTKTRSSQSTTDLLDPSNNTSTRSESSVITRQINVPAVTYSLNIANANSKRNEVLARPTLVALGNQTSNFFSGVDVNAAAVSNGQGSAVQIQKEVGVKLSVTPEFLPNNQIKLNIAAERTFLANPNSSVVFDFRLDTTKTMVNANVVMKFGETLILSGLSERDQSRGRDGVPLLQDLPVVQYLFSRNVERDYYKSVLILLTPRKAQYTNRADEDVAAESAQATPAERALAEFEGKYRPWFKPIPNIGEIVQSLENSPLYREFRTGDLAASWQGSSTHAQRLKSAVDFLFY